MGLLSSAAGITGSTLTINNTANAGNFTTAGECPRDADGLGRSDRGELRSQRGAHGRHADHHRGGLRAPAGLREPGLHLHGHERGVSVRECRASPTRATADGRQSGGVPGRPQMGGTFQGATGPGSLSTKEEERSQPGHSRRAEASPERPRGEDPRKGRSKGGKNRQGKHQARGTDDGGIKQKIGGGKPHLPMDAGHPGKTEAQTGVDGQRAAAT